MTFVAKVCSYHIVIFLIVATCLRLKRFSNSIKDKLHFKNEKENPSNDL